MRSFYFVLAIISAALGIVCLHKGDHDTFRYCVIMGMLFNIYAKVEVL